MNLSEFLPEIYLEAQGCPEAVALNSLRHTLREFCERSKAWQADLDSITLLEDQPSYDIDVPPDADLMILLSATYDGAPIQIYTPEEMDRILTTWRTDTGTGVTYLIQDWTTLYVSPIPTADDATPIYLRGALKPTMTATTCGDILDTWREGITAGALGRLKAIPNKAWTDREGASYYGRVFASAVSNATVRTLTGFSKRSMRVTPRAYV